MGVPQRDAAKDTNGVRFVFKTSGILADGTPFAEGEEVPSGLSAKEMKALSTLDAIETTEVPE